MDFTFGISRNDATAFEPISSIFWKTKVTKFLNWFAKK